ncbi:MAG: DUF2617 family protein [Phycisphaerae bacterium]|nr:DUF2617 family protein [Phycisphaerae bacterium]
MAIGQKQTVGSLRFLLYERALHPELFRIDHDCHVVRPAYEAQVWVTGCTHVIGFFRTGDGLGDGSRPQAPAAALVQVIAGADATLPQRGLLLEMPFRGEQDHERRRADGINYMMNFQLERLSTDAYLQTHRELARMGARRGLFVPFPRWRSREMTPFSYIDYEAKPGELHVMAFHAFPADSAVVKTQSVFELS